MEILNADDKIIKSFHEEPADLTEDIDITPISSPIEQLNHDSLNSDRFIDSSDFQRDKIEIETFSISNAKRFCSPDDKNQTTQITISDPISDQLETFGKYVTEELKSIKNDTYSIQVAKHKINQILFDATTGEFKRD